MQEGWYNAYSYFFRCMWSNKYSVISVSTMKGILKSILKLDHRNTYEITYDDFYKINPITFIFMILDSFKVTKGSISIINTFKV